MTKTRSGDEADNTNKGIQSYRDLLTRHGVIEYPLIESLGKDNTPLMKERIGMKEVFEGGKFKDAGFMLPLNDLATVVSDVDEHALMFANLGEVYGNESKSLAHLMFNT